MIMTIDGLQIEVTRKNVKRLNMRVRKDGSLAVSAPIFTSNLMIINFVRSNRDWIDRALAKSQSRKPIDDFTEADRRQLKARIAARLPQIEAATGLRSNGWTVRKMTTRWGSCNTRTHHLNFSLMLADQPDDLLDYVIVHELVHTKVADHGPRFKAYMDKLMPDWRARQRRLRG